MLANVYLWMVDSTAELILKTRTTYHINYYMNSNERMTQAADNIRILAASMVERAKSGHPGGGLHQCPLLRVPPL